MATASYSSKPASGTVGKGGRRFDFPGAIGDLFADDDYDDIEGDESEVKRLIELNGMIGVDPSVVSLD